MPCSAKVGTSGKAFTRFAPVVASARSPPLVDERNRRGQSCKLHIDAVANKIEHRLCRAPVGYLVECHVSERAEPSSGKIGERLRAERAVPNFTRLCLGQRNQFGDVVCRKLCVGGQHIRRVADQGDRGKRLHGIIWKGGVHGSGNSVGASRDNSKRVAIRRRSRQSLYAKTAAGAGLVLHYEPMTQPVSEFLTHNASEDRCRSLRRVKSRRGSQRSCHGKSPPGRRPLRTPQSKKPAMLQQWPMRLICSCSRPHPAQNTEKLPPPHARSLDFRREHRNGSNQCFDRG